MNKTDKEVTISTDVVIRSWQKLPKQPKNSPNLVEHKKAEVLILQQINNLLILNN